MDIKKHEFEKLDKLICDFLNVTMDDIISKLDTSEISDLRSAAAKDDIMAIHHIGYQLTN